MLTDWKLHLTTSALVEDSVKGQCWMHVLNHSHLSSMSRTQAPHQRRLTRLAYCSLIGCIPASQTTFAHGSRQSTFPPSLTRHSTFPIPSPIRLSIGTCPTLTTTTLSPTLLESHLRWPRITNQTRTVVCASTDDYRSLDAQRWVDLRHRTGRETPSPEPIIFPFGETCTESSTIMFCGLVSQHHPLLREHSALSTHVK